MASTSAGESPRPMADFNRETNVLILPISSTATHYVGWMPVPAVIDQVWFVAGTKSSDSGRTAKLSTYNDWAHATEPDDTAAEADVDITSTLDISTITNGKMSAMTVSSSTNKLRAGQPLVVVYSGTATALANAFVVVKWHPV